MIICRCRRIKYLPGVCVCVCNAVACGVLGILYYFIFCSRVQCSPASRRRLLEHGSGGLSSAHDTGGSAGERSTHIFMFKKS